MIRCLTIVLFFLLFVKNVSNAQQSAGLEVYEQYVHKGEMAIQMDRDKFHDLDFTLKIPKGLVSTSSRINGCFINVLSFEGDQMVITLYIPFNRESEDISLKSMTSSIFSKLFKKEGLNDYLEEFNMIKRGRRFSLNKYLKGRFYVLYINVRKRNLESFNYSVGSVLFN